MKSYIKIGRDATNDVVINEPRVSRNHAAITIMENGDYEVKDLGSSNGTYINGKKIITGILRPGDRLQVASSMVDWQAVLKSSPANKSDLPVQEDPLAKISKTITIGSADDNDLVIKDDYVSNHHAKISLLRDGSYYLLDMGSSNGSFVNGIRVMSKNFSRTDFIKIASSDLPDNWLQHNKLRSHFYKDHRKAFWIILSALFLITAATLFYFNRCRWFGWGCNLSARQMYSRNQNSLVHIDHSYYYIILVNGTRYYVGKNKDFPSYTVASPDKDNLLYYNKVSGNGCFISADGVILTSPTIINPWLNEEEEGKMLKEVIKSRTIAGFNSNSKTGICGETAELNFLQNNAVNNKQNYTEAHAATVCTVNDNNPVTIQSVKKTVPANATIADYSFKRSGNNPVHHTDIKYYGYLFLPPDNQTLKDTFYVATDTININRLSKFALPGFLENIPEGSPVFNSRGELIGITQSKRVILLQNFIHQIQKQ